MLDRKASVPAPRPITEYGELAINEAEAEERPPKHLKLGIDHLNFLDFNIFARDGKDVIEVHLGELSPSSSSGLFDIHSASEGLCFPLNFHLNGDVAVLFQRHTDETICTPSLYAVAPIKEKKGGEGAD